MKPQILVKQLPTHTAQLTEHRDLKYVQISLDPASKAFGIAVFTVKGEYIDSFTIHVAEGIIPTMRLYFMRKKFIEEWEKRYGVSCVANLCILEHIPPSNIAILQNAAGAILSSGKVSADLLFQDYISPTSWKCFCRELGCRDKDPKGLTALKSIGWQYPLPDSDDSADAIILYLCSRWRKKLVIFLGNGMWLQSWYEPKVYVKKEKRKYVKRN